MSDCGIRLFEELMRFKPPGLTANGWAVRAGVSRTIWADLRRHGNPSRRTLEKLLAAAGSSLAEFEALRVGQPLSPPVAAGLGLAEPTRAWRAARLPPIPQFPTRPAGVWGAAGSGIELLAIDRSHPIDRLDRPPALAADRHAYAVATLGQSMWPRFRAGRRLLVSPAKAVAAGDDVLVELAGGQVLIKELVRRSADTIGLRQFSPDVTFEIKASEAAAVHRIIGEAIG
jgi:phage repressor protein C with HTH and peptisase S24 domain